MLSHAPTDSKPNEETGQPKQESEQEVYGIEVVDLANALWFHDKRFDFPSKSRMPKIQVQCVIEAYLRCYQPFWFEDKKDRLSKKVKSALDRTRSVFKRKPNFNESP